jgi:hypothetical protein
MPIIAKNIIVGGVAEVKPEPKKVEARRVTQFRAAPPPITPPTKKEKYVEATHVKHNKDSIFYKDSPYIRELLGN